MARAMLGALRPDLSGLGLAGPSAAARAMARFDMTYPETEATQAACLPGAAVHAEVADRLTPVLRGLM